MARKKRIDLNELADKIVEIAEKHGAESNFLFLTTFRRYQRQLKTLTELEKQIDEKGPMVTKEYVKGRENMYVNPAINAYNSTSTAANQTVQVLIKIILDMRGKGEDEDDELLNFLSGK